MYPLPWNWLVPPREVKLYKPPVTTPNSGAKFEVWSVNSWIASTEGCDSSETRASRPLLDSCPSNRMRNPPLVPFTVMLFHPLMVAPGVICVNDSGLRIAPAPIPKLIGRELSWAPVMVVDCSPLSVLSRVDSAPTSIDCVAEPTCRTTSTLVVTATCTEILVRSYLLKPACSTESLYVPTESAGRV